MIRRKHGGEGGPACAGAEVLIELVGNLVRTAAALASNKEELMEMIAVGAEKIINTNNEWMSPYALS